MLLGCDRSMMPTPLIYRDSGTPIFDEWDPALWGDRIPVLYLTDRKPASEDTGGSRFYGSERSTSAALGFAEVEVGPGAGSWEAAVERRGKTGQVHMRERLPLWQESEGCVRGHGIALFQAA